MNDFDTCKALLKIIDEAYGAPVVTSFPDEREEVEAKQVEESYPMGVRAPDTDEETVSYSKTKSQGDAQVTVSANAKSMDELHDVLRLAGIEIGSSEGPEQSEPEQPEPEQPEPEDAECDSSAGEEEPGRDAYSTDKQKIIDVIKARLANKLS